MDIPLRANGVLIDDPDSSMGKLEEATDLLDDAAALRRQLADRGYLYLPGLLPREDVMAARAEILMKYAIIGEIDAINHSPMDAIQSEHSFADQVNLRAFTESVRTGLAYERIVTHERIINLIEKILQDSLRPYDFRWPRFVRHGEGCGFHYDGPYMSRGTVADRIFTTWIPLGDIARHEGALTLLEGSHQNEELLSSYALQDADKEKISWLGTDPNKVREHYGGRWLSTDFRAGDVLCFGMHVLHGALDNQSPEHRCRLSSDSRYQSANEPLDERWNGPKPEAHGYDKVFFPGLGAWDNLDFQDEWKTVDSQGRLKMNR